MKNNWIIRLFSLLCLMIISCEKKIEKPDYFEGSIQLLNGCGAGKVTEEIREKLMVDGFDVVETGNADFWNFEETIIAVRNPHWPYAQQLAKTLKTNNIILLENSDKLMDATVYIGRDYKKICNFSGTRSDTK